MTSKNICELCKKDKSVNKIKYSMVHPFALMNPNIMYVLVAVNEY